MARFPPCLPPRGDNLSDVERQWAGTERFVVECAKGLGMTHRTVIGTDSREVLHQPHGIRVCIRGVYGVDTRPVIRQPHGIRENPSAHVESLILTPLTERLIARVHLPAHQQGLSNRPPVFPHGHRIGASEAWIERVSPRQRGTWFGIERDSDTETFVWLAHWSVQISRA